jgi:hypothetical protein
VLAARLPGFAFQQMTAATPSMAFTMYVWPMLWIAGLMFFLAFPRFELLKRGQMASEPQPEPA